MCNQMPFGFPNQMPNQNMFMPDYNNYNNSTCPLNQMSNQNTFIPNYSNNNNSNCPLKQMSDLEQRVKVLESKVQSIENKLNIPNTSDYQYQSSMYMM